MLFRSQPGVAAVTAGPGVTDVVTAVANAFQAGSPMLVLGGRSPVNSFEKGTLQELDHIGFMKPITKWARTVFETKRIPEYISIAYRNALAGRPGPVFLECPIDVLESQVDESQVFFPEPAKSRATSKTPGNPDSIKAAAKLLAASRTPVVIAGNTVYWSQASRELQKFVEALHAPVFLNGMGRGCISSDNPQFFVYSRRFALSQADVAVLIGTEIDFRLSSVHRPCSIPKAR